MKKIMRWRVAIIAASLLLSLAGLTYLAYADLTTPLTVDVSYPPTTSGGTTVGGAGRQQVFRLGSSTATGDFLGLNPKAGTCPAGSIAFLSPSTTPATSQSAIGVNDFVYAIKINNTNSNVPLTTELNGLCPGRVITSVGYCQNPPAKSPTDFVLLSTGLDFFFDGPQVIPLGETSTILFYTSPDPPSRQPTAIGSSGVTSNGEQPGDNTNRTPIYGPCPTTITIDKQIACSANGPFTNGPQTALAGSQIFYKITVTNTGMTPLDNVSITDVQLKPGGSGNITADFTFPSTPGHLNPSESVTQVFGPFTATTGSPVPGVSVNGTNTAVVDADYMIPAQDGTPSGQSVHLSTSDQVILNVVAPSLQCNKTVEPQSFNSFPATLTYHLKVTNTGGTDLAATIDDTKLRAIITSPPAGVTINSIQITSGAGFAAGSLTGGNNLPATFPAVNATGGTNPMAQVDVSLTIATFAAFQSLADDAVPPGSNTITNQMTAMGMVTNFTGCTTGATGGINTVQCSSQMVVMFVPPCMIMLEKTVACGTSPGAGDFSPTATALKNAAIVYRYRITNGLDTMNNVVISDNKISSPLFNVGTLGPNEVRVIDVAATAPLVVGPFVNTASVSGVCSSSGQTMTSPQVNATVTVINPQVNCNKLVNGVTSVNNYLAGQTLTYTLTASNAASSGTNLDVTVADPTLAALPGVACKLADNSNVTLPFTFLGMTPGQSQTITCTVSFPTVDAFRNAAGGGFTLNNTMSVSGALPPGSNICTTGAIPPPPFLCSSTASVSIQTNPNLMLTKEVACADPALNCANGVFQTTTPANPLKLLSSADGTTTAAAQYRFRVTNTGDITINNIVINDDKLGSIPVGNLAPGVSSSFICPAPFTPPLGVTTNTARAVGTSAFSPVVNNVQSNQVTATVQVQRPSLSCSLSSTVCQQPGDPVTLTLTLTNGPLPITIDSLNVSGLPSGSFTPVPPFPMAANETKVLTVTFPGPQANTTVTVTANGTVNTSGFCLVQANGNSVNAQVSTTCTITLICGILPKCDTICFKTPSNCELLLDCCLPNGAILIGGLNFNNPINVKTNVAAIKKALHPCLVNNCTLSPLQQLNQQFVAAQLSLLSAGGSAVTINVLWGTISCYGGALKTFTPITLSDGTVIGPNTMLKVLFMAAETAIRQNRTQDMVAIANIFKLLLGSVPGSCGPDGVGLKISLSPESNPDLWEPQWFVLPRRIRVS